MNVIKAHPGVGPPGGRPYFLVFPGGRPYFLVFSSDELHELELERRDKHQHQNGHYRGLEQRLTSGLGSKSEENSLPGASSAIQ